MKDKPIKIQAIRGMKDIFPPASSLWQKLEETARDVFKRYNYKEIRTPICEKTELFSRSIGEETDIVEKEMFTFEDRNGESMTLRPEGTASVVRACIESKILSEGLLNKFYYMGPMFRYEKPQKGRQRQFSQIGAEAIGQDDAFIDVEMISMCDTLLKELSIKDYAVEINSLGTEECRKNFTKELTTYLDKNTSSLCDKCKIRKDKNPLRVFDCKESTCKGIIQEAPKIINFLNKDAKESFESVKEGLKTLGINFKVNPMIVRGLDYYSKTVFEFTSNLLGSQNAILGGGRYNNLVAQLGGKDSKACGFALGMERLILALDESFNTAENLDVFTCFLGDRAKKAAFQVINELRSLAVSADMDFENKSLKSQLSKADKHNALFTVIIGEEELKKNALVIRDMNTKEQIESKRENIAGLIKRLVSEKGSK